MESLVNLAHRPRGAMRPRAELSKKVRCARAPHWEYSSGLNITSPDGDNYLTLKREEAKEFRLKWLERKMAT